MDTDDKRRETRLFFDSLVWERLHRVPHFISFFSHSSREGFLMNQYFEQIARELGINARQVEA